MSTNPYDRAEWTIRRAGEADADALAACIDAAYDRYVRRISDLPAVSEGCAQDIATHLVWVACVRDNIIGGAILMAGRTGAKLANIAVHPDYNGQGVGRALMTQAEAKARALGFKEMQLRTHVGMPGNIALYLHLGWEEVARTGTTVTMRKAL